MEDPIAGRKGIHISHRVSQEAAGCRIFHCADHNHSGLAASANKVT